MPKGQTVVSSPTIIIFLLAAAFTVKAQPTLLKNRLETIIAGYRATVGICMQGPESQDTLSINGSRHFPMQSVYKFPIALAILHEVDKGKLSVDQKVMIRKADLRPNTWSPIREKYPDGNISMSLEELLGYTVSRSDNNGCDILLRLAGGTARVNHYMHSLGIKDIAVAATEAEMATGWNVQFNNRATPTAAVQLLQLFYNGKILSVKSRALLLKIMTETSTGSKRLKGLLPEGTTVAHKTGTSNTNDAGLTAATNDIGFITLPDGRHFTIAVFITDTYENGETNEHIIAAVAKAAWDYFTGK